MIDELDWFWNELTEIGSFKGGFPPLKVIGNPSVGVA
jgi:hypothetical protein